MRLTQYTARNSGFTLVELAVVLVIIGLLVGSIVTGNHLMHTLKLKKVGEEYHYYQSAILQFRDRYFALPGDMPNATDYWGQVDGTANCLTPTSVAGGNDIGVDDDDPKATCNGNGDAIIASYILTNLLHEGFRAWQHMSNAGVIPGQYTGMRGDNNVREHEIGENSPTGPLTHSGWGITQFGDVAQDIKFDGFYGNLLVFGRETSNGIPSGQMLTPQEAWDIDNKFDDGMPATGNVNAVLEITDTNIAYNCTTAEGDATDMEATYSTSSGDITCALYFQLTQDAAGPL